METIDLHGDNLSEAHARLSEFLTQAARRGEPVVRVIHGQGKHSDRFPVLKSAVRKWLEDPAFAGSIIRNVFRGEDGSPYTKPNAGETVVVLAVGKGGSQTALASWEDEEADEARRQAKGMRADRLRHLRRQGPRR